MLLFRLLSAAVDIQLGTVCVSRMRRENGATVVQLGNIVYMQVARRRSVIS